MGSFSALAGLFLLLSADLLASMQLMMYIGGMLVMILFMVKMSMDPGGAMMGIALPEQEDAPDGYYCPMHPDVHSILKGKCPKCGMGLQPSQKQAPQHGTGNANMHPMQGDEGSDPKGEHEHRGGMEHDEMEKENKEGGGMSQMDMSMTNDFTKPAAAAGILSSIVLLLVFFSVRWPDAAPLNHANAALFVGKELLGRYMIAFEAGGLLILLGVVGATIFGGKE